MNKQFLSGLIALLLAGCPKNEKSVETLDNKTSVAPPSSSPSTYTPLSFDVALQLVVGYLIKNNALANDGITYQASFGHGQEELFAVMYTPQGKKGDYTDDTFSMAFLQSPPAFIVIDEAVDGTVNIVTNSDEATPYVPMTAFTPEDQEKVQKMYRDTLTVIVNSILETEDVKTLQEMQPK